MSNELMTSNSESLLSPSNFEHAYRIAKMMSTTQLIPKAFQDKPADILVAFEFGRTLGLGQLQAIQNIAVINGKPSLYGDAVLAVCSGHRDFENIEEKQILDTEKNVIGYSCSVKRKGRAPVVQTFTIADAKLASLWGKQGPWRQYPNRMLQMRARGFALRDCFADALGGMQMAEEVHDYSTIKDVTPKSELKDELKDLVNKNKKDAASE